MAYPTAAWERAMLVQEVLLKAVSGEWRFKAAEVRLCSKQATARRSGEPKVARLLLRRLVEPLTLWNAAVRRVGSSGKRR